MISVIIPLYADKYIVDCITSILASDVPKNNYEIIVVSNNAPQHIVESISHFPIEIITETQQGSYAARNAGAVEMFVKRVNLMMPPIT